MPMQPYRRLNQESGVTAFDTGPNWIRVEFVDAGTYTYIYASAGPILVEHMKLLAEAGQGLSAFISRHVRHRYAARSKSDDA